MIYDVLIIGATYLSAGLSNVYGKNCIVIERRPQAGYEFINALKFGTEYNKDSLKSNQAKNMYDNFVENGLFDAEEPCLFGCAESFYKMIENDNIILNTEVVDITNEGEHYTITTHGVSGFRTFKARKIIDTCVHTDMVESKTYNVLVDYGDKDSVVKFDVSITCGYKIANEIAYKNIKEFDESNKMIMVADCFDYTVKSDYEKWHNGVLRMPSCEYKNPIDAYDAGVCYAMGDVK